MAREAPFSLGAWVGEEKMCQEGAAMTLPSPVTAERAIVLPRHPRHTAPTWRPAMPPGTVLLAAPC